MRKEENVGGTTTYPNKIYVSAGSFDPGTNGKLWAHFWKSDSEVSDLEMTKVGDYYECTIPTDKVYTKVWFVRQDKSYTSIDWTNKWNQSTDGYAVTNDLTSAARLYTFSQWDNNGSTGGFTVSNIASTYSTTTGGHTYYEFDSTNGKDNAYIESINKSNKTATINYYNASQNMKVSSAKSTPGFFPFNRNDYVPNQSKLDYAQDLGFGMKLTIPFTLNGSGDDNGVNTDGTDQTFDFSGDDDLWVFVDDKLVLDLGGAHGRTTGSINFHTKTVTATEAETISSAARNGSFATDFNTNPNYVHTMTIYYMERGMIDSNLQFGFSFHAIPNQFWIDKKIRTKDIINAGFYADNGQTDTASNKNAAKTEQFLFQHP